MLLAEPDKFLTGPKYYHLCACYATIRTTNFSGFVDLALDYVNRSEYPYTQRL